jgi:hypothetical protein
MFRNEFMHKFDAKLDEIAILASEDTHYSIPKASNLLQIDWLKIPVGFENREIDKNAFEIIVRSKNTLVKNTSLLFPIWEQPCLVLLIILMIILLF